MYEQFNQYVSWLGRQPLSPATKRLYERAVACFCRYLHAVGAADPTAENITAYLDSLAGCRASSRSAYLAAIRSYCHYRGMPLPAVAVTRSRESRPRTLSDDERERLMHALVATHHTKTAALIAVFLQCGLKVGEVCARDVQDVSVVDSHVVITVHKASGSRAVSMNSTGTKLMIAWLTKRLLIRRNPDEKALFLNNNGGRLSASGVKVLLDTFGNETGLHFTAQVLRNTCLKTFVMQTRDIKAVAQFAGYTSAKSQSHLIRILPPHVMASLY